MERGEVVRPFTRAGPGGFLTVDGAQGSAPWLQVGLLLATVATTTWAGAAHLGADLLAAPGAWVRGLPYAAALLAILGVHEMGHYVMGRRRGIRVSLPYFIPVPFWLGTFGAFIRMEGPVRRRADYFDVGLAGPVAGLAVALVALAVGLRLETVGPGTGHGLVPASSVLVATVYRLVGGTNPVSALRLGPIGFAGWLGLMVTAINLLPVGQLDGGHLAYAILGPGPSRLVSVAVLVALIGGGLLSGSHLLMWGLLLWLIAGTGHPPAQDETAGPGAGRALLGGGAMVVALSILLPLPT